MSIQKVNHNVWQPFVATTLTAAGGATESRTSEWWDVGGWTDKRISWQMDGANTDFDIDIHISPKGYYELNNEATVDTEDYEVVSVVEAHGAQILASKDAQDIDELQRPFRSVRVYIENDSATAVTDFDVWFEGWS
jgi:hypothetical protein